MQIGWNGTGIVGRASIETVAGDLRDAKANGYKSYWLADHPSGGFDALTALTVAGGQVSEIEIGTAIVPMMPRHPMALAAQTLTAQQALDGRLTLGIGLSHKSFMAELGIDFDKPIRYLREYLSILMPLLKDGHVDFEGELLQCRGRIFERPMSDTQVVMAALGPQALRVTGRLADGTILAWTGPNTIKEHIAPTINEAASAAGRPSPRIIATLPVCVTEEPEKVRAVIDKSMKMYTNLPSYIAMFEREGVAGPGAVAIVGSAQEVTDQIGVMAEAGTTDFTPTVFAPNANDRTATAEVLGKLIA
ncbi:MAG: TIGR03564 family F420-dependent LLM class oxidoreductase [Pseudomonadota bacterium]